MDYYRFGTGCLLLATILAVTACGTPRRYGDPEAPPVSFAIELERGFVNDMDRRGIASVGLGMGFNSRGYAGSGLGLGLHFRSTRVFLLGYDAAVEALLFRQELKWGDNRFAVPLLPQRELLLVVEVGGSRQGRERIGKVRADEPQPIAISLDSDGSSLLDEPPATDEAQAGAAEPVEQAAP